MKHFIQIFAIATNSMSQALQQPSVRNPLAISLGAISGSLCRYYIGLWFARVLGMNFPYGTLFINLTGSFVMGLFLTLIAKRILFLSPEVILLVTVGFLGSYTTFSSYELDSIKLFNEKKFVIATFYWLGSPILGLIGIQLGIILANNIWLNSHR
jgi:fluoride exporter